MATLHLCAIASTDVVEGAKKASKVPDGLRVATEDCVTSRETAPGRAFTDQEFI